MLLGKLSSCCFVVMGMMLLAGCGKPQDDMGGSDGFKPPQRPKELDRLDAFVGHWEGTTEMTMAGAPEPIKSTGTDDFTWAADKWLLMENLEADMGEGGKMKGVGLWSWNPDRAKYRIRWFDNAGTSAKGWAHYDEDSKTWHYKSHGKNAVTGIHTYGQGTTTFPDENTQKWTWKEWDNAFMWGDPILSMTGTNHRK